MYIFFAFGRQLCTYHLTEENMRRQAVNIQEVKRKIAELRGKDLSLAVNKGRNQIVKIDGQIIDLFPYVFTFRARAGELVSFSYSDIICGDIRIGYTAN